MSESDQDLNLEMKAHNSPRYDISDELQRLEALQYLQENGYVVIAGVSSEQENMEAREAFWTFSENVTPELKRDDPTTWKGKNWIADTSNGIHNARGFNHSDFLWNARMLPAVRKAFGAIWNTDDLIVSYDAGNVFRPWKFDENWLTHGGWWHVDQNCLKGKSRQGLVCVQGVVTYYDATEDTGGLCVIPGSHKHHEELCARTAMAKTMHDFVPVKRDDPLLQNGDAILVCAKAGDLILWDSRTVHCNTPAPSATAYFDQKHKEAHGALAENTTESSTSTTDLEPITTVDHSSQAVDLIRLCAYVCMVPRSFATAVMIEKRKFAFVNKIRTSHWPAQLIEHGLVSHEPRDPAVCSREMLELAGYRRGDWDVRMDSKLSQILSSGEGEASGKCSVM